MYYIHHMDVEMSSSFYVELVLQQPTTSILGMEFGSHDGSGWYFDINFIADIKLSIGLPSTPKSIMQSIMTRSDPYHPSFEENGK